MAVTKLLNTTSFTIEVESGTDKTGAKTYSKKNFSGIRTNAFPQNVFDVAEAIKGVLLAETRDYYLNESSKLVTA